MSEPSLAPAASPLPILTYVEADLPAPTFEERIELAAHYGLALEVAHRRGHDLDPLLRGSVPIATLQAFDMHELHPLHPDEASRREAVEYLHETIDLAGEHGIPRVLTACGFGEVACAHPLESCLSFYREIAERARNRGVRILIELLSPHRARAMSSPADLAELFEHLDSPATFRAALDLGHLSDAGLGLEDLPAALLAEVEELQLKRAFSHPPDPGFPLTDTLRLLPRPPAVVCVEHRHPILLEDFHRLVANLSC